MPAISTCPRCQEPVSIPDDVDLNELVHCPLCMGEFLLSEAVTSEQAAVASGTQDPEPSLSDEAITPPIVPNDESIVDEAIGADEHVGGESFGDFVAATIAIQEDAPKPDADESSVIAQETSGPVTEDFTLPEFSLGVVTQATGDVTHATGEAGGDNTTDDLVIEDDDLVIDEEPSTGVAIVEMPVVVEPFSIDEFCVAPEKPAAEAAVDVTTTETAAETATEADFFSLASPAESETAAVENTEAVAEGAQDWPSVEETAEMGLEQGGEEELSEEAEEAEEEGENAAVAALASHLPKGKASLRRRPEKKMSFVGLFAKLFMLTVSAVLGLLAGYYAIAWWTGPNFRAQGWPVFKFLPYIEELTAVPAGVANAPAKAPTEKPKVYMSSAKEQAATAAPAASQPKVKWLRPQPGSVSYVGPRVRPTFTTEQLSGAIKAAEAATANETAGGAFSQYDCQPLYDLCQKFAFVNGPENDEALRKCITTTTTLFQKFAARPGVWENLGRLALARIGAKLDPNSGILVTGTLKNIAKQGHIWEATVELAGQSKTVNIASDHEFEAAANDQVLVIGAVVRDPGASVVAYIGSKPIVVWTAAVFKKPSGK